MTEPCEIFGLRHKAFPYHVAVTRPKLQTEKLGADHHPPSFEGGQQHIVGDWVKCSRLGQRTTNFHSLLYVVLMSL